MFYFQPQLSISFSLKLSVTQLSTQEDVEVEAVAPFKDEYAGQAPPKRASRSEGTLLEMPRPMPGMGTPG